MNNDALHFTTIAENWRHFAQVDIAPNAPLEQRSEMERAFMAGAASMLLLVARAKAGDDEAGDLFTIAAEIDTWLAVFKARHRHG